MNPSLVAGQSVKYVTGDKKTVDGTIQDIFPPAMAHVQWGEKNVALARYSEGKEPNTFHLAPADASAAEEKPRKPFTPGAKASPEKPNPPARKRPHQ